MTCPAGFGYDEEACTYDDCPWNKEHLCDYPYIAGTLYPLPPEEKNGVSE